MSRFTHSICEQCWAEKEPGRVPYALLDPPREPCCYCGREHQSGIRLKQNPELVACGGISGIHKEEET